MISVTTLHKALICCSLALLLAAGYALAMLIAKAPPPPDADALAHRSLLSPPLNVDSWACECYNGASGFVSVDNNVIVARCYNTDGTGWHFQIHQDNQNLTEGRRYTIEFAARSDEPTQMNVLGTIDRGDYHDIGMQRTVSIGRRWKLYRWSFVANSVLSHHLLAPQFNLGNRVGTIYLADVALWDTGLAPAVNIPAAPPVPRYPLQSGTSLLSSPLALNSWAVEGYQGATGHVDVDGDSIVATCYHTDGTDWHYQLHQRGLDLEDGATYTVQFAARSDKPTSMWVEAIVDSGDYHDVGMKRDVELTPQWSLFTWSFKVSKSAKDHVLAPQFEVGHQPGTVWLADVSVCKISPVEHG